MKGMNPPKNIITARGIGAPRKKAITPHSINPKAFPKARASLLLISYHLSITI